MKEPNKVVSARGQVVDFELLRMKQEMSTAPTVVKRETKSRRRRRLSERGAAIARETGPMPDAMDSITVPSPPTARELEQLELNQQAIRDIVESTTQAPAPRIVRKKRDPQ